MKSIKHAGAAIILALMITAIVASIAATMMYRERIGIRQATLIFNYDRMRLLTDQATFWAESQLTLQKPIVSGRQVPDPLTNSYGTFKPFELISSEGIQLVANLQDQQGLFNLNCLENPANQFRFEQLIRILDAHITAQQANGLARAVTAWFVSSNADQIYLNQQPPYRAAHRLMASSSELRLVRGITQAIYQRLAPFVTALPAATYRLNVNTAPLPVLVTLTPGLTLNKAKALQACQRQKGVDATTASFQTCAKPLGLTGIADAITTTSQYFMLRMHAHLGSQQLYQHDLLYRYLGEVSATDKKAVLKPQVLMVAE